LENIFKKKYHRKYALAVSSGRKAMRLIIENYKFPLNSEIIFPCVTFHVLPTIIRQIGLKPVFINCNPDLQMDIAELKAKINEKTKAIIATHYFGKACAIDMIMAIAKKHRLIVIEDCAHVAETFYKNRLLGSWGHAAFFSFQNRKLINGLTGGILLTDDKEIYMNAKKSTNDERAGFTKVFLRLLVDIFYSFMTNKYVYRIFNFFLNFGFLKEKLNEIYIKNHHSGVERRTGFSNLQARLIIEQLKCITMLNSKRLGIAERYNDSLRAAYQHGIFAIKNCNYYAYIASASFIKKLKVFLFEHGIDANIGEEIVFNCGAYYDKTDNYKKTQLILNQLIELPMYYQLNSKDQKYIIDKLNVFFANL